MPFIFELSFMFDFVCNLELLCNNYIFCPYEYTLVHLTVHLLHKKLMISCADLISAIIEFLK